MSTNKLQNEELFNFLISEAKYPFSGWDFSYIKDTGRSVYEPLSWSYTSKILMKIRNVESLLDMGTGGGEFLSLLQPLPPNTYATEGYAPNVPIAKERLESLGVKVYAIIDDDENANLPFEDNQFDLIINKHESYTPNEIFRILKPNCQFITQQVGGLNDMELNELLGANMDCEWDYWDLEYAIKELEKAGMQIIEQKEDFPLNRFFDIGAIVYHLKAISWQISDFSLEKYFDMLIKLHNKIQEKGYIDIKNHRFFIIAQNPK